MTTDDERRRVAAALRDVARAEGGPLGDIGFTEAMHRALGGRDWRDMMERLADLIDPTCLARPDVEDTPDGGQFECWSCSVCGNIVSSDPDYDADTDGPTYCEVCGHRITGEGGADMAVTDDERRRVAAALRAESGPSLTKLMWLLGVGGEHLFSRLADFIDPDATSDTTKREPDTTKCDREALLALADGLCDGYPYGLSHGGLEQLARRIREACGEVAS